MLSHVRPLLSDSSIHGEASWENFTDHFLVGLYPQINKGNSIPLIRLQATEDLQKLNPDTVLNLSFYI